MRELNMKVGYIDYYHFFIIILFYFFGREGRDNCFENYFMIQITQVVVTYQTYQNTLLSRS